MVEVVLRWRVDMNVKVNCWAISELHAVLVSDSEMTWSTSLNRWTGFWNGDAKDSALPCELRTSACGYTSNLYYSKYPIAFLGGAVDV